MRESQWIKCISTHGNVRGVALEATALLRELGEIHKVNGESLRSLGEAVMGAILIASYCKDREKINLNIRSSGNIFQALVDAHPDGTVRGYVIEQSLTGEGSARHPISMNTLPDDGIVFEDASKGPWGEGVLSVLRTKTQEREQPYIGTVPLLTGHLAKDLTFYWVQSEQIPSAVGLAVAFDEDGQVKTAGGFLVQALPGASPTEIRLIEEHINEMHSLTERLAQDSNPLMLLSQIFQDTAFVVIEEKPLRFECGCSWERVRRALTLVGVEELQAMLKEDQAASVRCDFCAKEYKVDAQGLQELIAVSSGEKEA